LLDYNELVRLATGPRRDPDTQHPIYQADGRQPQPRLTTMTTGSDGVAMARHLELRQYRREHTAATLLRASDDADLRLATVPFRNLGRGLRFYFDIVSPGSGVVGDPSPLYLVALGCDRAG
jgi:hypothetical protein